MPPALLPPFLSLFRNSACISKPFTASFCPWVGDFFFSPPSILLQPPHSRSPRPAAGLSSMGKFPGGSGAQREGGGQREGKGPVCDRRPTAEQTKGRNSALSGPHPATKKMVLRGWGRTPSHGALNVFSVAGEGWGTEKGLKKEQPGLLIEMRRGVRRCPPPPQAGAGGAHGESEGPAEPSARG